MVSKIIELEKERQERILSNEFFQKINIKFHISFLINLKEYMESEHEYWEESRDFHENGQDITSVQEDDRPSELKEDIKELTKMIERYG
jgi:hypothetical protein